MRKILFFIVILIISVNCLIAQTVPNKIIINEFSGYSWNIQHYRFMIQPDRNRYRLFYSDSNDNLKYLKSITKRRFTNLVKEIYKKGFDSLTINLFGIDSVRLKTNAENHLKYCSANWKRWTDEQRLFTINQLQNISNYNAALKRIIQHEGSFIIHQETANNVELSLIYNNDTVRIKSNPAGLAYRIPWQFNNEDNKKIYNTGVSKELLKILKNKWMYKELNFNRKLLEKQMVKEIFNFKCRHELCKLSPNQFKKEIDELISYFKINNVIEYEYGDQYMWGGTNFKIDLHNSLMFDNVSIALFLERTGNTIYSRDSIINKAEFIIKKVQGIQFIHEYLKENPQRKLVLMFNNGASINNKIIERFNGTPESWERHDNYIKSFEWDKAHNIKLSFDIPKAIKTSERNECGCNFRLDNEYLRKGIYFQIFSEDGDRSDWILLPNDNKPILWFFQGQKVYRYTYKDLNTSGISVQHVCKYFDEKGNVINKK